MDYKGQCPTADGKWLYPLTVMGADSLYVVASVRYRLPECLRRDNGCPVASTGAYRSSKLAAGRLKLGIVLEQIQRGKPQRNGRLEPMHRVLNVLTARPPAATCREQHERFDRFRDEYNQVPSHETLT